MSRSPHSERILFLVSGYVLGTLEEAESKEFAQIVAQDPSVLKEVDGMQQALEQAYDIAEQAPPPELKSKLLAAVQPEEERVIVPLSEEPGLILPPPRRRLWIAAIAAMITLSLSNLFLWRQLRQQTAQLPEPIVEQPIQSLLTYRLEATDETQTGTVEVAIDPVTLTAQLDASQLPVLPPNQTYALWTVLTPDAPFTTDEKGAVLITPFQVTGQGSTRKTVPVPAALQKPDLIAAIAVTIEQADAPQVHEGAPVLISKTPL